MQDDDSAKTTELEPITVATAVDDTQQAPSTDPVESQESAALSALESGNGDMPLEESIAVPQPVHINNYVMNEAKKSHKGLIIGTVSLIAVLLLAAGSLAYWYFAIR